MKVVFFCLSSSLAHAGRVVRLARALAARGHTPILAGQPGFLADPQVVAPGEFTVETIWEPDLAGLLSAARGQAPRQAEHVIADRMLTDELALIDKLRPDLVVTDNRRTAVVSAEIRKIPSLSLVNASMLGPHLAWAPRLDSLARICGPVLGATAEQVLAAPAYAGKKPSDPIPFEAQPLGTFVEGVIKKHGGKPRNRVHQLCFGDRTLILDPPSLMPTRDLPPGARQVGPFFAELMVERPSWWDQLKPSQPLVYLTYGSTGGPGFPEAVRQLGSALQVAVTTAHLETVPDMPKVRVARYLPPEIMGRARVVVCHGGTQTVYQALSMGTPVVSLPGHLETAVTAIALVQAKMGVAVAPSALAGNPKLLRRTVEAVLADAALRSRVAEVGIDHAAALQAAVDDAESLA
jgi:UDP:flavonoid glycosyltransferase YjiC (YdhE family)